jgi:hypothetical protein
MELTAQFVLGCDTGLSIGFLDERDDAHAQGHRLRDDGLGAIAERRKRLRDEFAIWFGLPEPQLIVQPRSHVLEAWEKSAHLGGRTG